MSKELENDVEEDSGFESRRSRRSMTTNVKQGRQSVLEQLKQARATGKSFRARVDNLVQDVYMEVDDEEYQAKKRCHREFVEDDDGGNYYEDDSEEDELDGEEDKATKKRKEAKRAKAKAGTIKHHFQVISSKQKPQDENSVRVDEDDILKETLAELVGTSNVEEDGMGQEFDPFTNCEVPSSSQQPIWPQCFEKSLPIANIGSSSTFTPSTTPAKASQKTPQSQRKRDASPMAISPSIARPTKLARTDEQHFVELVDTIDVEEDLELGREQDASPMAISPSVTRQTKFARTDELHRKDGDKDVLKFYFLDAFEDIYKHPGTIYLFGRVKKASGGDESCCLVLRNISRQLFFVKRQFSISTEKPVTQEELSQEVQNVLKTKLNLTKFRCKSNLVEKKFISADATVPRESEALEVWVNCGFGRISADLSGDCFSHVMNTTTTAMERLLVERDIYGPCWIEVRNAERAEYPVSHCPLEYNVNMERMEGLRMVPNSSSDPPPPITLISLNILTALNAETKEHQIVMASLIHHSCNLERPSSFDPKKLIDKRFCVISKFNKGLSLPFDLDNQLRRGGMANMVRKVGDEMALLNIFLAKLEELNPDMILGHDLNAQLLMLQARMEKHKLKKWDRLGRLKRSAQIPKIGFNSKFALWEMTAGRLCLDSKTAASELIHSRSYEMEDLVVKLLKLNNRVSLSTEHISEPFLNSNSKLKLVDLVKWNWNENLYTLKIVEHLNAIPLFVQITQIVGGVLSRTLMGGRAERNEYLLLHACHKNNYVPPDKHSAKAKAKAPPNNNKASGKKTAANKKRRQPAVDGEAGVDVEEVGEEVVSADLDQNGPPQKAETNNNNNNKKTQYTGGLVLEPKRGLYETYIVLLDFNSLYPSIIQEFNICFTTVDNAFAELSEADLPTPPGSSRPDGILKNEIRKLVSRRKEVKKLMKQEKPESDKYQQYNIRQMGLKLTANSMYGCLGFQNSRFFAKALAAMVTSKGRELLMHAKQLVENENFPIIYGDTDSLMVNTNTSDFQQAKLIGQKLKQVVNKNYSLLELDIDAIYRRLLLLKKKKYAALSVDLNNEQNMTPEMKGLDIVRRDWSELAKDVGEEIVNLILTPSLDRDTLVERIRGALAERRRDLDEGRFPLEKFEILKQLTRDPAEYKDTKSQPHAQIALRLNESKKFRLRQGDIVKYVICTDGTNSAATQRGYHASEIIANRELSIDKNYYLAQQIHPVVTRLVEPIEELDSYQIAELLGLDPTSYRRKAIQNGGGGSQPAEAGESAFCIGPQQDFDACEGLAFECPGCHTLNVVREPVIKKADGVPRFGLANCTECGKDVRALVKKQLRLTMADHIKRNTQVIYTCDEITCGAESCVVGRFQFSAEGITCTKCKSGVLRKNYPDKKLFDQQCFFKFIADLEACKGLDKAVPITDQVKRHYRDCHTLACTYLDQNAFNKVDLSVVFAPLIVSKQQLQQKKRTG